MSGEPPDIGEAVDYILAERPRLNEEDVWAVLVVLETPPAPGADGLAVDVVRSAHPRMRPRQVKLILREWRAYAGLAAEPDWDDDEGE